MLVRWTSILFLAGALATGLAWAENPAPAASDPAAEIPGDADPRELFLRCCWALGRAGFNYCEQYGVCESDPKASCTGVGAAEGMTASCASKPPDLPESGG